MEQRKLYYETFLCRNDLLYCALYVSDSKCLIPAEKISNVEDLFVLLCAFKGFSPQQTDLMGFEELLIETNWDYEPHTLCPYHNWRQSKYCALAIAMKMW